MGGQSEIRLILGPVSIGKRVTKTRRIPHNFNSKMHWGFRSQWNNAWYDEICWRFVEQRAALYKAGVKLPLDHPQITFTLFTIRLLDFDNARGACKPLLDALKVKDGLGIIVDDSPAHIPEPVVRQVRVKHRAEEHVEISVGVEPVRPGSQVVQESTA